MVSRFGTTVIAKCKEYSRRRDSLDPELNQSEKDSYRLYSSQSLNNRSSVKENMAVTVFEYLILINKHRFFYFISPFPPEISYD